MMKNERGWRAAGNSSEHRTTAFRDTGGWGDGSRLSGNGSPIPARTGGKGQASKYHEHSSLSSLRAIVIGHRKLLGLELQSLFLLALPAALLPRWIRFTISGTQSVAIN